MDSTSTPGAGPSTTRVSSPLVSVPPPVQSPAHEPRRSSSAAPLVLPPSSAASEPALPRPVASPSAPIPSPAQSSHAFPSAPFVLQSSDGPPASDLVNSAAGPSTAPLRQPSRAPDAAVDPPKPEAPIDETKMISEGVRLRVFLTLAQDQLSTIKPDVSAFRSHEDVLQRLLPYHLWQIPEQDLRGPLGAPSHKGKGRAREIDEEEQERAELKEALGFAKRKRRLERRFAELRQREGLHASPSDMSICLNREVANDVLPQVAKTRSEALQLRQKQTILDAQINQIRNPALPPPPPRPPALPHAPAPVRPPTSAPVGHPLYRPPQGYPSTPIYRPAPGGGTYQPSMPLPNGPTTATRAPSSVGRPPVAGYQPPQPSGATVHTPVRPLPARPPVSSLARPPAPRPPSHPASQSSPLPGGAAAPATAPVRPTIDFNAPRPLSVPIAYLPKLQAAGILPDPNATPPLPGLATDIQIDRENVRFTVILSTLAGDRIRTLSEVLSLAHGAEATARAKAAAGVA